MEGCTEGAGEGAFEGGAVVEGADEGAFEGADEGLVVIFAEPFPFPEATFFEGAFILPLEEALEDFLLFFFFFKILVVLVVSGACFA